MLPLELMNFMMLKINHVLQEGVENLYLEFNGDSSNGLTQVTRHKKSSIIDFDSYAAMGSYL